MKHRRKGSRCQVRGQCRLSSPHLHLTDHGREPDLAGPGDVEKSEWIRFYISGHERGKDCRCQYHSCRRIVRRWPGGGPFDHLYISGRSQWVRRIQRDGRGGYERVIDYNRGSGRGMHTYHVYLWSPRSPSRDGVMGCTLGVDR